MLIYYFSTQDHVMREYESPVLVHVTPRQHIAIALDKLKVNANFRRYTQHVYHNDDTSIVTVTQLDAEDTNGQIVLAFASYDNKLAHDAAHEILDETINEDYEQPSHESHISEPEVPVSIYMSEEQ